MDMTNRSLYIQERIIDMLKRHGDIDQAFMRGSDLVLTSGYYSLVFKKLDYNELDETKTFLDRLGYELTK